MTITDNISFFLESKAFFGSFPTQSEVNYMEDKMNTRIFIDLTYRSETKIIPYTTKYTYISYPICDKSVPGDINTFISFIIHIANDISNLESSETAYLHCKGGHGRSGVVVASLIAHMMNKDAMESLSITNECHSRRRMMRERWRLIGSPQTITQKKFVCRLFSDMFFYINSKGNQTYGFSNHSRVPVTTSLGTFPTVEAAINAMRRPDDCKYVTKQKNTRSANHSRILSVAVGPTSVWSDAYYDISLNIIRLKFNQHTDLRYRLMSTGLRRLVFRNKDELYWGDGGGTGYGRNILGKILMIIRQELMLQYD